MSGGSSNARKRRVFDAVFPSGEDVSQPTPVVTPAMNSAAPGQAFGGPSPYTHDRREASVSHVHGSQPPLATGEHMEDQVKWDRSWHTVTLILDLPAVPANKDPLNALDFELKSPDAEFDNAIKYILDPRSRLPLASHTEDIVIWYTQYVRHHVLNEVLPLLLVFGDEHDPHKLLSGSVKILEAAHRLYLHGLSIIIKQVEIFMPGNSEQIVGKFRRDLHAIIGNSLTERLTAALKVVLSGSVFTILGISFENGSNLLAVSLDGLETDIVRRDMLNLVGSLHNVGLAGEKLQVVFAEIMNEAMTEYVEHKFKGIWSAEGVASHGRSDGHQTTDAAGASTLPRTVHQTMSTQCVADLCDWIENRYSRVIVEVFSKLDKVHVSWTDVEKWKEMSIGRLASLRTLELFDIVVSWPHSSGALDDLRTAITTPQRRLHLTDVFSKALNERLLHAGASTLQILQTYISMICSFHALDNSKVLLDRVAYPLQLYLCSREDTVRIIITGLLSDTEDSHGTPIGPGGDKLVELALLLKHGTDQMGQRANDDELDWNDMEWIPDPVDAGPGYRRSKNADIIGTLIGVLGSQEIFIKEFQNIVGENLLKHEGSFEKEIKVLELLKTRFGDAPLQSCEVMLKDIQDSGRVDSVIRRTQKLDPSEEEIVAAKTSLVMEEENVSSEGFLKPSLHAKILSRLFWPQLQDESYRIPDEIAALQKRYESGFESLKASRKLTWLHALGQATVELEMADRKVKEEVQTWQATVIWAFQSDEAGDTSLRRSVDELVQHLEMEESLVRSALKFWVSKLVLHETAKDVFAVLETLNQEDRARSNAQAAAAAAAVTDESAEDAALLANDGITTEKMQTYWQFIQGMLTNSSPQMPLQQIAMMLKMLIADGFPYSNEELQEFLGRKVMDGELELVKGKYRLVK